MDSLGKKTMRRVVLVTGCRSGLGLGTAIAAARSGWTVYAGLRDLSTSANLDEAALGLPVTAIQLDVTRANEREAAVTRILAEQGQLDALVNNAGVALGGFLEQLDEDELRHVIEVNVIGAWAMTKACLPALREAMGPATVVMVSSMAGRNAWPVLGAYSTSKFALEGMSESWRHELQPFGIRIVLVEPGAYRTEIFGRNRRVTRRLRDPDSPYAPYVDAIDELFAKVVERVARDPEEVCGRIVRILQESNPSLRVPIGPGAVPRSLMVRFIPFCAVETLFRAVLRRAARDR